MPDTIYKYRTRTITGSERELEDFSGKVILVVNTASKCGFTPQYEGLQALYEKYNDKGLEILGFPCDQFGHQEPGSEDEIAEFCKVNFGVSFPLFAKIDVNGKNEDPLYTFLKKEQAGKLGRKIKWNFTKFLVDREGRPVKRFAPSVSPEALEKDILSLI